MTVVFAANAVQLEADPRGTTFRRQHPRPRYQWRLMADVLAVAALEDRAPVALVILFEAGDALLHGSDVSDRKATRVLQSGKRSRL